MARTPRQLRIRRHARVRLKVTGTAARPYGEASLRDATGTPKDVAARVGTLLAERASAAGVTTVVFDRGGYAYHGRIAALADALRAGGVAF